MYNTLQKMRTVVLILGVTLVALILPKPSYAGSIFLTGHDILLHGGGDGYDGVILDYLRAAGTGSEIAKANYSISIVGTQGNGFASFDDSGSTNGNIVSLANGASLTLDGTLTGYESATFYDAQTADWSQVLLADVLVILSHESCGGCSITDAGSAAVNSNAAAIATAFNAGMDIWGLAGGNLATFYDFLPPSVAVSGPPISGSDFSPTTAGTAIGITEVMTDGDATHNRFTGQSAAFTIFETRLPGDLTEVVSIGVRDATIGGGGLQVCGDPGQPPCPVPEPSSLAGLGLSALGFAGLAWFRRRRSRVAG